MIAWNRMLKSSYKHLTKSSDTNSEADGNNVEGLSRLQCEDGLDTWRSERHFSVSEEHRE